LSGTCIVGIMRVKRKKHVTACERMQSGHVSFQVWDT